MPSFRSSTPLESNSSSDDDDGDKFEKSFKHSKKKIKHSFKVLIKQVLQYQQNSKRSKLTTPGVNVHKSHLIKIEVTDSRI